LEWFERWLRRHSIVGAQLGGLAGDEAELRTDGARYVHPHFQRNSNELRDWSYDDAKSKYTTAGLQSKAAVQAAIDTYQRRKG
jgi:hypothetical protein